MPRPIDRDQAIERALQHTLRADALRAEACPDAEAVAAWAERALPTAEAASLESHVADCLRCQALVAAFSRSEPEPAAPPSLWARWRMPWLIPVATAATAVAIWIATPDPPPSASFDPLQRQAQESGAAAPSVPSAPPVAPVPDGPSPREADRDTQTLDARAASPDAARESAAPQGALSAKREQSAQEARPTPAVGATAERGAARSAEEAPPAAPAEVEANRALTERAAVPTPPPAAVAAAPPLRREAFRSAGAPAEAIEIASPDPSIRWRVAAGGVVERSTSGGAAWVAVAVNPPAVLSAGASPDPQVCWLVGRAGAIRITTDGVQFRVVAFPATVDLSGVRATSARSAVVTAIDGRAFRTDDQGATWTPVP